MEEREKSERSFRFFRRIYDFSMSTLILGIGCLLFGAKYLKIATGLFIVWAIIVALTIFPGIPDDVDGLIAPVY